ARRRPRARARSRRGTRARGPPCARGAAPRRGRAPGTAGRRARRSRPASCRLSRARRRPAHRGRGPSARGSRARCRWAGRRPRARPYDRGVATTLPRNGDVAEQLELLADLLEIEGQAAFRVLAYRRAAQRVRDTGGPVAQLALDGKAKELPGIGATIQDKIVQIVNRGEIEALSKRRKTIPPEVVDFLRIPGLGPKTVRKIWQELGVSTLAELKSAARAQRLRTLPGLGAKVEENILKSVGRKRKATGPPRTLLGQA